MANLKLQLCPKTKAVSSGLRPNCLPWDLLQDSVLLISMAFCHKTRAHTQIYSWLVFLGELKFK